MQRLRIAALATLTAFGLAGCLGGGGGGGSDSGGGTTVQTSGVDMATVPPSDYPLPSEAESARFLHQASMGARAGDIARVQTYGYAAWLEDQFNMPGLRHLDSLNWVAANVLPANQSLSDNEIMNSFWKEAAAGQDQLRRRVGYALSQIFVISLQDAGVSQYKRGTAAYLDMLNENAFGNYRTILENVSRSPMMGIYLSHMRNQKEDPTRNRVPDQNYAREIMQLFSIGLWQLNPDGSQRLVNGQPVETYGPEDIAGLAKVFTGFSWGGADKSNNRFFGNVSDPNRELVPMQGYPNFHSVSEKRFLGTTIPVQNPANPDESLRIALDTIYNHPNVGPFIGKLLIQRMVTSNPSAAYVTRVAEAFNTGRYTSGRYTVGTGVRGDMKAVVAAVLLDREARDMSKIVDPQFGRVREPLLRMANWMRAFNVSSASGRYLLGTTDDVNNSLGMSPMRSPTVFNFYRAGYVPPNTAIAAAGLVAPEMQIVHETSVVGYSNFMRGIVQNGAGSGSPRDIQANYATELSVADNPDALIDRVDLLLTYRTMSQAAKTALRDAITSIAIPATGDQTAARRNRVNLAVFFALSSADFMVQK
jgi:uncharacterized protein (DUF1800 family)